MTYAEGDCVRVTNGPRTGQVGTVVRVTHQTAGAMKRIYWVRSGAETAAHDASDLAFAGRFFNGPATPFTSADPKETP